MAAGHSAVLLAALAGPASAPEPVTVPEPTPVPEPEATADGPRVSIKPLTVEGTMSEADRQLLDESLRASFAEAGYLLTSSPGAADYVIVPKLVVQSRVYTSRVEVFDATTYAHVSSSNEPCDVCGIGDVSDLLGRQAGALSLRIDKLANAVGFVEIRGEPEGAEVFVDGERVGKIPMRVELTPGAHVVELRAEGYLPSRRNVDAVAGVTDPWELDLVRRPLDVAPPADKKPTIEPADRARKGVSLPTGIGLLAGGVAVVATGVTFIILEERPYSAGCTPDENGRCPRQWRSVELGAASTATGGAALIAGAVLTGIAIKRRRAQVTIAPNGRGLSLAGRF